MFAQMADQAAAQCPHTQIVLSGYRYESLGFETNFLLIDQQSRSHDGTSGRTTDGGLYFSSSQGSGEPPTQPDGCFPQSANLR